MFFFRSDRRRLFSVWAGTPWTLMNTRSRTPWNVLLSASISICLIFLLIGVFPLGPRGSTNRGETESFPPSLHLHRDARAHGGADRDRLDEVALDAGRLGGADLIDEGVDVVGQLVLLEAHLADAGVDVAALVGAIFDLAGLELADGGGDVAGRRDDGAGLGRR